MYAVHKCHLFPLTKRRLSVIFLIFNLLISFRKLLFKFPRKVLNKSFSYLVAGLRQLLSAYAHTSLRRVPLRCASFICSFSELISL